MRFAPYNFVILIAPSLGKLQNTNGSSTTLLFGATNEYGECDYRALALYGLDLVVEPYRETKLHVRRSSSSKTLTRVANFHWMLVRAHPDGTPINGADPVIDARGGYHATIELRAPGEMYALVVQQLKGDGNVVAVGRATVACKYVRRELRALTTEDRTAFFEAMRVIYTISTDEGTLRYGPEFTNYELLTGYHASLVRQNHPRFF